jgi:predicted amidophosphoribosyltransferase
MKEWPLGTVFVFSDGRSKRLTLDNFDSPEFKRLRRWPLEPHPDVIRVETYEDQKKLDLGEARRVLLSDGEFPPVACRPRRFQRGQTNVFALDIHTEKSSPGSYTRAPIAEIIFELKYKPQDWDEKGKKNLAQLAASSMAFYLKHKGHMAAILLTALEAIVPIPPSDKDRPFQPVYLLAEALGQALGLPVLRILDQTGGPSMKHALPEKRFEEIYERMQVIEKGLLPRRILLLDDLLDTGATMSAAISRLQENGVRHIHPVTFTATRTIGALARGREIDF